MTASDAERKLRELSFLHEVAQLAASARDWDEMLRIVIGRTTDAMGAEVSSLYLLERSDGTLRLVATNGLNRGGIGRATLRVGEGIVGWVANARVPLAARDVRTEPRSEEHTSELQSRGHLVCRLLLEKKKNVSKMTNAECRMQN